MGFVFTRAWDAAVEKHVRDFSDTLSEFYRNKNTKLRWQCARGHVWETTPRVIRRGHWCPECARLKQIKKTWLVPAS